MVGQPVTLQMYSGCKPLDTMSCVLEARAECTKFKRKGRHVIRGLDKNTIPTRELTK